MLPLDLHRCDPCGRCPQALRCARFLDDHPGKVPAVDGLAARDPKGCGMFIDVRGVLLTHIARPQRRENHASDRL